MIKCLCIQILLGRAPNFDRQPLLTAMHAIERFPEIDVDEGGAWLAFNLFTEDLASLWAELEPALFESSAASLLRAAGIIVSEGEYCWSEDRLLFHHDPTEAWDGLA